MCNYRTQVTEMEYGEEPPETLNVADPVVVL